MPHDSAIRHYPTTTHFIEFCSAIVKSRLITKKLLKWSDPKNKKPRETRIGEGDKNKQHIEKRMTREGKTGR